MNNQFFNNNYDSNIDQPNIKPKSDPTIIETPQINVFGGSPEEQKPVEQPVTPVQQFNPLGDQQPVQHFNPLGNQQPMQPQDSYQPEQPVQQFNPLGNQYPQPEEPVKEIVPNGNAYNSNQSDTYLVEVFVGKNVEKFTKTFNWAGFFFGTYYLLYRKMVKYFFVLYGILIVLTLLGFRIGTLLLSIIIGFAVNPLYVAFADKKVQQIKNETPGASYEFYKERCAKKGGTNILYPILFVIIYLIIYNGPIILKTTSADLEYDKRAYIKNELDMTIPEGFEAYKDNTIYLSAYYKSDYCAFSIGALKNHHDVDTAIDDMYKDAKEKKANRIIQKEPHSDINWSYGKSDKGRMIYYFYGAEIHDRVYVIRYVEDTADKECGEAREELLNSIKEK